VYATQTAMAIDIVTSRRDPQWAARLLAESEFWSKAAGYVATSCTDQAPDSRRTRDGLVGFLRISGIISRSLFTSTQFDDVQTAVPTVTQIRDVALAVPDTYEKLRLLVPQIKRPYLMQSLVLISGCVETVCCPIQPAPHTTEDSHYASSAIDNTTSALQSAVGIHYEPHLEFSPDEGAVNSLIAAVWHPRY